MTPTTILWALPAKCLLLWAILSSSSAVSSRFSIRTKLHARMLRRPWSKANQPRERAIKQQLPQALSRGRLLPKLPRRSHSQRPLRPQHKRLPLRRPNHPRDRRPPPQGAAPAPPAAAAQAPAAAAPTPNAPAPSQAAQPSTVTQTAPSNDDLELAFNGHCRECHSFVKDDNRLGPNLYGVVGRKAGTVPNFAYSESVKGSGITWDEPTLDKWITNPNTLIQETTWAQYSAA